MTIENVPTHRIKRKKKSAEPLPVSAFGFYAMARSNLLGAQRIASTISGARERCTEPSIQFLCGFAAEGYLKAFLRHYRYKHPQMLDIGHDLECALKEAQGRGLRHPAMDVLTFVIETLAPAHMDFWFRYLPDNLDGSDKQFTMLLPQLLFDSLGMLDEVVFNTLQNEINAEEVRLGKTPTATWPGTLQLRRQH